MQRKQSSLNVHIGIGHGSFVPAPVDDPDLISCSHSSQFGADIYVALIPGLVERPGEYCNVYTPASSWIVVII